MEILSVLSRKTVLSRKINLSDIHEVVAFISENEEELAALWGMIYSEDRTVSVNALYPDSSATIGASFFGIASR